ncbi:phosphotransferase enzyme family protein-like protein [Hypoxylon rubiginosum]|uniref:Phosphotransferase enzyme family protein-like protein n=1 Tax=Hypoxylon rubiginosum TaxID=110542 RepID=A0ACB9ZCY5_9PEZI|nr:phosphotransferase enzyme family protein-like protein [Hypoxylon rubiginosum]
MAPYDFIAEKDIKDERLAFAHEFLESREEIVSFVDNRLGWNGAAESDGYFNGSFNFSMAVKRRDSDENVIIRFPVPGNIYGPWRDEKVTNEVVVMDYLSKHTTIPVPPLRSWGITKESPRQLGPFIIMDLIEGQDLSDFLQQPTEDKEEKKVLDPNIDEAKLDYIYDQIADFMLQLSRIEFPYIGALSKNAESGQWAVTGRPLTCDMNEVVTLGNYPSDCFSVAPFGRASEYFRARSRYFLTHLEAQRNIAGDNGGLAWSQFVARRNFDKLIPKYCLNDTGPFRLYCDDMRPSNMLVDPETLRITAVLDFELTNVMPGQFACDPPWWLLLKEPANWVRGGGMQKFLDLYVPRMEQFIRAMERAEVQSPPKGCQPYLADQMRESWDSGRFWFDLASRKSFDVDEIYWEALYKLHTEDGGDVILDEATLANKESFLKKKEDQFNLYRREKETDRRFQI